MISDPHTASTIPPEYSDLAVVCRKSRETQLPPHSASDCAIDLLPGIAPPRGQIFPLFEPELLKPTLKWSYP